MKLKSLYVDSVMSEPCMHDICMADPPKGEGNPVVVASVYFDEARGTCPTLAEANAYAKLFAASPDLLAACKTVLDESRYVNKIHPDVVAEIRAAIAKAGGKP